MNQLKISKHDKLPAYPAPPIVGIGTSAGGLEAVERFLAHVPLRSGLAFVIVQHLDPTHKCVLPELLQRVTPMKVMEVENLMRVEPDCVYVIPPNKDLSLLNGVLHLLEPTANYGLRLSIDYFFRALALDQGEKAIGVILSGMGSDGTLGLRAIKEKAGLCLVQSPQSAKFDGMPRSAIDAGMADIVAPADELPRQILDLLNHPSQLVQGREHLALAANSVEALAQVVILLRERSGNDFSLYKKNTLYRRVERRMGVHHLDSLPHYARFLRENPHELDLLFKELLIGVTSFFRDPDNWELLTGKVIPELLTVYPAGAVLRAWVPACSTGEEAYSLAMAFQEALAAVKPAGKFSLQVFATDLDADAINRARQGCYPVNIAQDVSASRLALFFDKEENAYRIKKEIREMLIFATQNIIQDPPFTKLDIITCRNLLIYLTGDLQKRIIPLLHYALNPHGVLMLGNAETIGRFSHLFSICDNKARIYHRIENPLLVSEVDFPTRYFPVMNLLENEPQRRNPMINLQTLADQFLLQNFSPASVLVNAQGDILYINGRTGKYLEPAAGKANWNIHAMAREELRGPLSMALHQAKSQAAAVRLTGVSLGSNGDAHRVDVTVQAIANPEALREMIMVVFTPVDSPVKPRRKSRGTSETEIALELQQARNELQTLREEMQSSQEELKSTNEELQSTNEELQSTNEELTTSKEEMQSLNEELQTVNAELQAKVDDLTWLNNDMKNLLNSMEIATVFLDNRLNIRRFTNHATHLFKLIPSDVGRSLSDIVTHLDYGQLHDDAKEVLRTLIFSEKQVNTSEGIWYKVRIMPYRTQNNVIDGVVITFIDITENKQLEQKLLEKQG